ncbi:MAG: hypothetical protein JO078_11950 [Candidatus Eremiobacteraeota bacterium]|nr:hypothetical protein [Candidatus Eremiobacteraeota bacterium]MBV9700823.1 hypothetical protein [Candidatus Eremiobacteraeota bacterium]
MSQLLERQAVQCPYHLAQRYLADSVGTQAASGSESKLHLTASFPGIALAKEVLVTFGNALDPMHFDQPWHIHWKPQAGPYPEFDGELTVRADETYRSAFLELRGAYRPPGGALGTAFDWAAGSRIARTTARELLQRIGAEMEARYERDERNKAETSA